MKTDPKQLALSILEYLEENELSAYQLYRAERHRYHAIKLEAQQPDIRGLSVIQEKLNYSLTNSKPPIES